LRERIGQNSRISILAGIIAGLACWTKNEGFIFLFAIGVTYLTFILTKKNRKARARELLCFGAGAVLILSVVFYYKSVYAPVNDIIHLIQWKQLLINISDAGRYAAIATNFLDTIVYTNQLLIFVVFYPLYMGMARSAMSSNNTLLVMSAILMTIAGYFTVFVVTPYDLTWHLATSLSRLLMQIWPSIILLVFIIGETPERSFLPVTDS